MEECQSYQSVSSAVSALRALSLGCDESEDGQICPLPCLVAIAMRSTFSLLPFVFSASSHQSTPTTQNRHRPNFVVIVTDDLDLTLSGPSVLTRTKNLIASKGADLSQWFVHTPVCCPSRAELLTGKMFHNLKVNSFDEKPACMYIDVDADVEHNFYSEDYFARHFRDMEYRVGMFGKHLNNYNTKEPPPGVERWFINGGGDYLNPSFTLAQPGVEPTELHYNNCTLPNGDSIDCYSTSVIGNVSLSWISDQVKSDPTRPFFAYVAVKAPHIQDGPGFPQAIPAPWYTDAKLPGRNYAPRTPNYNASCPDHHWLVSQQPPLTELEANKVDELYTSRLRTLISVDDLVEDLVATLDNLGVLDNTYILFTSDNGYRFGQFRMPQGKFHPYENDIRVPMYIRGPGIRPGSIRSDILGTHIDIMPTLLSLAAASSGDVNVSMAIEGMDGQDLSPLLLEKVSSNDEPSRNMVLIEYVGLGPVVRYQHQEDAYNNTFVALRLIDPTLPQGWQNIKYVEYTDCRHDWNFTNAAQEYELFDLAEDPFEMKNIFSSASRDLLDRLHKVLRELFTCAGDSCRNVIFPRPSTSEFIGMDTMIV